MSAQINQRHVTSESDLRKALFSCKSSFQMAGFFSLFINLLLLAPIIYMLQVYDRVLSSSSVSTLIMLTLILVFLLVVMGGLEWIRSQILVLTSSRLDMMLNGRVYDALFAQSVASGGRISTSQPLSDLLILRQFLTGPGLFAFFDAPWLPIYIGVMFLFHFYFGVVAIISAIVLIVFTVWNELATKDLLDRANRESLEAGHLTQRNLRNSEAIEAMGMLSRLRARWQEKQNTMLALQGQASVKSGLITTLSKTFRLIIQSLILGLGAYLAIYNEISAGAVIAGSILLGRALAPLDLMISTWRGFIGAREAYSRLDQLLVTLPEKTTPMSLPALKGEVLLDNLMIIPPGSTAPVLQGINLRIRAGAHVAIIGPSAAGKSTLVRAMLGLYPPAQGSVRFDGAEISQWDREQLGNLIGYLPQDVELMDGTVSENIARFGEIDAEKVVEAARMAGIHEMILHLPDGYQTNIVAQGRALSAGQQQRLGLARAVYKDPPLIILDEPNSNLDQAGDIAFVNALAMLKSKGCTVLVITHRAYVLSQVEEIVMIQDGKVVLYGPRDQVLAALEQPNVPAQTGGATSAA